MTSLVAMRIRGFVRGQIGLMPVAVSLLILFVVSVGGGTVQDVSVVSVSLFFPALAWQFKLLFDGEPEVQTDLVLLAVGRPGREIAANLLAAAATGGCAIAAALALSAIVGGIEVQAGLVRGVLLSLAVHGLLLLPALAVGAWSSRAVTRRPGTAAVVLTGSLVMTLVLDARSSEIRWLAPPFLQGLRLFDGSAPSGEIIVFSVRCIGWSAVALAGYFLVRLGVPAAAIERLRED